MADRLTEGLQRLGLAGDSGADRLRRYRDELELWNQRLDLVSATGEELAVRHLLDSVAPLHIVTDEISQISAAHDASVVAADIGSGAGLPGIPLACFTPTLSWLLVERSGRRAGFLKNAVLVAGLSNVAVVEQDIDKTGVIFHCCVLRAFSAITPGLVSGVVQHLVRPAVIVAYKGRRAAIEAELSSLGETGREARTAGARADGHDYSADTIDVKRVDVPFLDEERHVVVFRFA